MTNTHTLKNEMKSSAKHYVSGVLKLIRFESEAFIEKLEIKVTVGVLMFVVFAMAIGWLSFSLVTLLSRVIALESAGAIMGAILLLVGVILMQTQKPGHEKSSENVSKKVSSLQKQILLNQIDDAKTNFLGSAKEVKIITLETLNPAKNIQTVVNNNPGTLLLGGFALGVFLGTKNLRARSVRII